MVGPPGVGVGVAVGVSVGVGTSVTVLMGVGAGVFSSSSPPQQAGTSRTNKLRTVKKNQYFFSMYHLPNIHWVVWFACI